MDGYLFVCFWYIFILIQLLFHVKLRQSNYLLKWNSFSNSSIWCRVYAVLFLFVSDSIKSVVVPENIEMYILIISNWHTIKSYMKPQKMSKCLCYLPRPRVSWWVSIWWLAGFVLFSAGVCDGCSVFIILGTKYLQFIFTSFIYMLRASMYIKMRFL